MPRLSNSSATLLLLLNESASPSATDLADTARPRTLTAGRVRCRCPRSTRTVPITLWTDLPLLATSNAVRASSNAHFQCSFEVGSLTRSNSTPHPTSASCARLSASEAPATTSCSICEAHYCGSPGHAGETGVCSPETFATAKPGESLWGRSAYDLADAILDGQSDELMNA